MAKKADANPGCPMGRTASKSLEATVLFSSALVRLDTVAGAGSREMKVGSEKSMKDDQGAC